MKLCLGTVQLGMKYGIAGADKPTEAESTEILDTALSHGINIFDTSRLYGSEEILGGFFENKPRNSFEIATKLDLKDMDGNLEERYEKEITTSLAALKLNYVDYYLFHNGKSLSCEKALLAMRTLKEKGYAKRVGVSVYSPDEAISAAKSEYIDCIQIPYNAIDKRLDKADFFETAEKAGKTVFCRSILLQGLLAMPEEKAAERLPVCGEVIADYGKLCRKYGVSGLEFATSYIKGKKGIDFCVFGVDNVAQLKQQLALQRITLPEAALNEADELFADVDERILDPRKW